MRSHFVQKFLFCACLMLAAGSGQAQSSPQSVKQTPIPLPGWIVLVLKPIGADRVRPVTGVVVSGGGLVIVPMGFAAPGDQIIVLDGGTDIVSNGRAATIRRQLPEAGLTLLSAPALKRRPASLSAAPLADGENIRLAAFPPAELIAQGAAPVSVASHLASKPGASNAKEQGPAGLSMAEALPNVSGPLLDSCGNLVGFSSAEGVQSMDTTKAPAYLWKRDLAKALQSQGVTLVEAACPPHVDSSAANLPAVATASEAVAQPENQPGNAPAEAAGAGVTSDAALHKRTEKPRSLMERTHWLRWLGLLTVMFLAGLLWWVRRRRAMASDGYGLSAGERLDQAPQQPLPSSEDVAVADGEAEQSDCVVEISGHLPDGTPFTRSCAASSSAINLRIGRGRSDIVIDSQDVHREHARLSGSADLLTITDLGSTHGTWINRVPCLKGEIMFIDAEDTVFLGNVSFRVTVRSGNRGNAGAS